jgi:hypothetical protein
VRDVFGVDVDINQLEANSWNGIDAGKVTSPLSGIQS